MAERRDPYELICNNYKTTITVPGGIALGYGPGPGLRNAIFWNRIGSLFSSYRPSVALLTLFSADDEHHPVPLTTRSTRWQPNLPICKYSTDGLLIEERRTALKAGLRCLLKLKSDAKDIREWILVFHGTAEQWPFFDYNRREEEPLIECAIEPHLRRVKLTQPHIHDGLGTVNSIQTVTSSHHLAAYGFGLNEGDLHAMWQDHGCLGCLKMRLGQVGGRLPFIEPSAESERDAVAGNGHFKEPVPITMRHRHPLYYFAVRVRLDPGEMQLVSIAAQYHTDDAGGELPGRFDGTAEDEWQHYLSAEVPQLDCDDEGLLRYWYYVWYVLKANQTAPGGHITHPYTAPSKYMYWGTWIWDAYFHVLGEMWLTDPEVAKNSIRAVLDSQYPNGYIPTCSGSNYRMGFHEDVAGYTSPAGGGYCSYLPAKLEGYEEGEHPFEADVEYRDTDGGKRKAAGNEKTQTPLLALGAMHYCLLHRDLEFAREILPSLLRYDDWLWRRRTDKEGRFVLWHGDESGWDNATRHYPVPARPFDVQVHCLLSRMALLRLLRLVEEAGPDTAPQLKEAMRRLEVTRNSIESYWNDNDQWYYDFAGDSGDEQRKQIAPSGLFSLLRPARPAAVEAARLALGSAKVFNVEYPIPTLAQCDPDYAPHGWGWNGPAWLQVNYFTITGLLQNGAYPEAFQLWEQTRRLIIRDGQPHSYELYDPEHGTGMGCPDYSWQAMVNHLLIRWFAGVDTPHYRPALPPGLDRLRISNLPGLVQSVSLKRTGRTTHIVLEYTGAVHPTYAQLRPGLGNFPLLIPSGLGDVESVTGNGHRFVLIADNQWIPPEDAAPATTWELIITCH